MSSAVSYQKIQGGFVGAQGLIALYWDIEGIWGIFEI